MQDPTVWAYESEGFSILCGVTQRVALYEIE
jgi:hypothetical protein